MRLRKLLIIFVLAPLVWMQPATRSEFALVEATRAQTAGEWARYNVGEEFTVLLPVLPAMTTDSAVYARDKSRRERTLGAYMDGIVYVIHTFEKKGLSLDDLIARSAPGQKTETVILDGMTGKSSTREAESVIWNTKWLDTGRNLYKFEAVASKSVDSATAIAKFFSSISFRKNQDGRRVFDGPGDQPLFHVNSLHAGSIFRSKEMTVRAKVVSKPEPSYTERARQNQITGTVVLRAVFSASGAVENISVMKEGSLPDGLTEKAIEAARQIRFIPAIKDGRFVSMWIQLEYNFNLY